MTYNCEEIVIPLINEPSVSVTTLYVTKTCCGEPEAYTYCNPDNKTNLLNLSLTVDNLVQIKEDPAFTCFIEMTWDEYIEVDLTDVVSFTGIKETYISSVLTATDTLDLTYFNTTHSVYTASYQADRSYVFNLTFTLANGITIIYYIEYHTTVDIFSDSICSITGFVQDVEFDYDCINNLSIDEVGIHFPIVLTDGFYSASWEDYTGCFIVECDETFNCIVKKFIEKTFNTHCYTCNKKKDLEDNLLLIMYYNAFISDCLDCCEKCNLYTKIINITKGCKDC